MNVPLAHAALNPQAPARRRWLMRSVAAAFVAGSLCAPPSSAEATQATASGPSKAHETTAERHKAQAARRGGLVPSRVFSGVNRAIPVRVAGPLSQTQANEAPRGDGDTLPPDRIELVQADSRLVEYQSITSSTAAGGIVDLSAVFPSLWTNPRTEVLLAQLYIDHRSVGAPVVIEPIWALSDLQKQGMRQASRAAANGDARGAARHIARVHAMEGSVLVGYRLTRMRELIIQTTLGDLRFRLRPDLAPRTVVHISQLVSDGYYSDVPFHRVLDDDGRGNPLLVQFGDPTGTGLGEPPQRAAYELSNLPHTFGTLSLARRANDADSGGGQLFICLSREACSGYDGLYTAIGELVSGASELVSISEVPVRDVPLGDVNYGRPVVAPVVLSVSLVDGQPIDARTAPATREHAQPAAR